MGTPCFQLDGKDYAGRQCRSGVDWIKSTCVSIVYLNQLGVPELKTMYVCLSVYFARLMVQETYANERRCCTRLHCIRRGVQEIKKARKRTITDHGYNWQKANDPFKDVERVTATLWYMQITSIAGMTADENRIASRCLMCSWSAFEKKGEMKRWRIFIT